METVQPTSTGTLRCRDVALTPRLERLPDGRWVSEIRSIDDAARVIAGPVMVDLLLRSAVALTAVPGTAAFALSAEIASCLRQINPDHPE